MSPATLREFVILDLTRACQLIERIAPDPIDPQWRIASPDGDWWIAMPLDDDPTQRARQLQMVSRFMAWKLSPCFVLASELVEPDSVYAMAVSHHGVAGALVRIDRKPLRFGMIEWLERDQLGDELPALLPRGSIALDVGDITELRAWFGATGKWPAVKIATGDVGA